MGHEALAIFTRKSLSGRRAGVGADRVFFMSRSLATARTIVAIYYLWLCAECLLSPSLSFHGVGGSCCFLTFTVKKSEVPKT